MSSSSSSSLSLLAYFRCLHHLLCFFVCSLALNIPSRCELCMIFVFLRQLIAFKSWDMKFWKKGKKKKNKNSNEIVNYWMQHTRKKEHNWHSLFHFFKMKSWTFRALIQTLEFFRLQSKNVHVFQREKFLLSHSCLLLLHSLSICFLSFCCAAFCFRRQRPQLMRTIHVNIMLMLFRLCILIYAAPHHHFYSISASSQILFVNEKRRSCEYSLSLFL